VLPGLLAVGDVTMLTHVDACSPISSGITAAENAMGWNSEIDYTAIPMDLVLFRNIRCWASLKKEANYPGRFRYELADFPFAGNGVAAILGQRYRTGENHIRVEKEVKIV